MPRAKRSQQRQLTGKRADCDRLCERVGELAEVSDVEVHQVTSGEIWTDDRMAEDERRARRERFDRRIEEADITPYAERSE